MAIAKRTAAQPDDRLPGRFPIRTVANLTGVNPVTLRAWERRYQLLRPERTAKGHRLYSQQDVERIRKVLDLLDRGIAISQVTSLLEESVQELRITTPAGADDIWTDYQSRMRTAISRFDEAAVDFIYNDALSLYPVDLVNNRLTTPLLRSFGEHWKQRAITVAEEHFFSVYLRNKLGSRIHHLNQRSSGPLLLLACLPGEYHELGLLFFALAAVNRGYRLLILGANMPLEQLPAVIEQRRCDAIVLSGSARLAPVVTDVSLPALVKAVKIPVFVGGAAAERHDQAIRSTGALCAGKDIQPALQNIGETLAAAHR